MRTFNVESKRTGLDLVLKDLPSMLILIIQIVNQMLND